MDNPVPLDKLIEVSNAMAENRLLEPVLDYAIRTVLQLFEAEYGYLILLRDNGTLDFRVCQDAQGYPLDEPEEKISHTILQKVIRQQESLIIADAIVDREFKAAESVQALRLRSVMCVPMISRGKTIGALYLENRSEKDLFTQAELLPLKYFASQAAIAIENALLNEELEARVAQRTNELLETNRKLEEQMHSRQQIESELRKLSSAVEQSPSSIIITNTRGEIEYVNPAFEHLTGYTLADVKGQNPNFQKSGHTPESVYKELWQTITKGETWRGEFVNKKKNGELYWEFAVIAPIRNDDHQTSHYVAIKEDITLRKQAEEELKRLAALDPLTGIFNRRHLFKLAGLVFEQAKRYGRELSVMMIDADHFKQINDQYGHTTGDQVLQALAQYLTRLIRKADLLGRYGGEEFLIILPETSLKRAYQAGERLLTYMHQHPIQTRLRPIPLTLSIGVACFDPETTPTLDKLVDQADQALYLAKQAGRNCVTVYPANPDFAPSIFSGNEKRDG
ncbi:MAG TPA: diguanylate cyclase [Anaerolineales bacterium]|nr:diguanylate cyclase [Anaerolineales bacterium]